MAKEYEVYVHTVNQGEFYMWCDIINSMGNLLLKEFEILLLD